MDNFTEPLVPTGMNTGVWNEPCGRVTVVALALPSLPSNRKLKAINSDPYSLIKEELDIATTSIIYNIFLSMS